MSCTKRSEWNHDCCNAGCFTHGLRTVIGGGGYCDHRRTGHQPDDHHHDVVGVVHHAHCLLGLLRNSSGDQLVWSPPLIDVTVLDNGIRVAHLERDHALSVVCVLHPFGFVDDIQDRAGLAHLVEHVGFSGESSDSVSENLSHLNGRTRFDSIDFYSIADEEMLTPIVQRMLARFSRPVDFATLETQKQVVLAEIKSQAEGVALGGFPWTELPSALYEDWAHAHNGYGSKASIEAVTLGECQSFVTKLDRCAPTLAVVGPRSAFMTVVEVCREMPARVESCVASSPRHFDRDTVVKTYRAGDPLRAIAIGAPLPGLHENPAATMAGMTIARLLKQQISAPDSPTGAPWDFGTGFFGPFTTAGPEVLIATSVVDESLSLEAHRDAIRRRLERVGTIIETEQILKALKDESLSIATRLEDSIQAARLIASVTRVTNEPSVLFGDACRIRTEYVRELAVGLSTATMGCVEHWEGHAQ